MRRPNSLILLVAGMIAGTAASYWYAHRSETVATPAAAEQSQPTAPDRTILYYRNPMGYPDTSPVPKKDSMGMDYIPVYADEQDDPNTVKVSLDKIQRSGVRTEKVEARGLSRTVRGIENAHKHLERTQPGTPRVEILIVAASEVGPALFFSLLIITVSFLPIFSLEAQEGRLFKPLAYTKTFSMAAAALLSLTLAPALMIVFVRSHIVPSRKIR